MQSSAFVMQQVKLSTFLPAQAQLAEDSERFISERSEIMYAIVMEQKYECFLLQK